MLEGHQSSLLSRPLPGTFGAEQKWVSRSFYLAKDSKSRDCRGATHKNKKKKAFEFPQYSWAFKQQLRDGGSGCCRKLDKEDTRSDTGVAPLETLKEKTKIGWWTPFVWHQLRGPFSCNGQLPGFFPHILKYILYGPCSPTYGSHGHPCRQPCRAHLGPHQSQKSGGSEDMGVTRLCVKF